MPAGSRTPSIVVVGAGIMGASIAFHLTMRGARVTLIEGDAPASGATRVSFAWVNARDKDPRHYHELNRRSLDVWPRFAARVGATEALTRGGELRWVATSAAARTFNARVRQLQSWGYPIRSLDRDQVRELEPGLETGEVASASYSEADLHVDAVAVTEAAIDRARGAGLQLRAGTKVRAIAMLGQRAESDGRAHGVILESGETVPADVVVLAAGTAVSALAQTAGLDLPQGPTYGATVLTTPVGQLFRNVCVIHTARDHPSLLMNMRQLRDGAVMIHGGTHNGSIGDRSSDDADRLLEAAFSYLPPLREAAVREVRTGYRPMPRDGHPVIGFARAVPNLYLAITHSGVTLAPLFGQFAATEVLDGVRIDALRPFRIERFR